MTTVVVVVAKSNKKNNKHRVKTDTSLHTEPKTALKNARNFRKTRVFIFVFKNFFFFLITIGYIIRTITYFHGAVGRQTAGSEYIYFNSVLGYYFRCRFHEAETFLIYNTIIIVCGDETRLNMKSIEQNATSN